MRADKTPEERVISVNVNHALVYFLNLFGLRKRLYDTSDSGTCEAEENDLLQVLQGPTRDSPGLEGRDRRLTRAGSAENQQVPVCRHNTFLLI